MIDRPTWQRASAALDEGLAIAPDARPDWLAAMAERDAALAGLVRRLLARGVRPTVLVVAQHDPQAAGDDAGFAGIVRRIAVSEHSPATPAT